MTDPTRDPELARALRDAGDEPPLAEVDWEALRGRIAASAELPLARLRREAAAETVAPAPAAPAARRRRSPFVPFVPFVPFAAAAGLAAAALVGALAYPWGPTATEVSQAPSVDEVVDAALPESVGQLISGEAAEDALLEAVVGA